MNLWKVYCPLCRYEKVQEHTLTCPNCNNLWLHREFVKRVKPEPKLLNPISDEEQLKRAKERAPKPTPKPQPQPTPTPDDDDDWDWDSYGGF